MEGSYAVYFGKEQVGKVTVHRQGLYYRVFCRCRTTGGTICRLRVRSADKLENLGILVPTGDGFGLDTNIPVKRLGGGEPEFMLVPKHEKTESMFVPIYPEEPFAYISRLKEMYLAKKDGQIGLILKGKAGA